MGLIKPALIHSVFLPSLKGAETKMSASDLESSIYLSDTDKQIQKKVGNAFSGGQDTREEHRRLGGRTAVDIPFQYLKFFLEDDDELERIRTEYESGAMETGQIKKICTGVLQQYVKAFRERRQAVDEHMLERFLRPRALKYKGKRLNAGKEFLKKHIEASMRQLKSMEEELDSSEDEQNRQGMPKEGSR